MFNYIHLRSDYDTHEHYYIKKCTIVYIHVVFNNHLLVIQYSLT